jgi:hypothetical protein
VFNGSRETLPDHGDTVGGQAEEDQELALPGPISSLGVALLVRPVAAKNDRNDDISAVGRAS